MRKYLHKRDILNFALCYLGAIACLDLVDKFITKTYDNHLSFFFYILLKGFLPVILPILLIYFFYLITARVLSGRIKSRVLRIYFLSFYGLVYLFVILGTLWAFSNFRYHTFSEDMNEPNLYLAFSMISIIQVNTSLGRVPEDSEV
jgi:hypothetical protein